MSKIKESYIQVSLDGELKRRVKLYCVENNISIKDLVIQLLTEKLK